jgi:hypothetical protein
MANAGSGLEARNNWAWAVPGATSDSSPASAHARDVLLDRQPLLDHAVLQERVLHRAQRFHADGAVVRHETTGDLVGTQHRLGAPADLLADDLGGLGGLVGHETDRREQPPHQLADVVALLLDPVLGDVLDLADPARRHLVHPHQHLRLAGQLGDGATVAPHEGVDLLAGQRGELGVEAAEADDLDVLVRVPALLLGHHAREDPGGGPDRGDADRLALEIADRLHVGGDVEREMVALGVRRHHLERHAGLAEHEDVGAAGGAQEDLAGDDRLHEGGAATERHELDVEVLGAEHSLLDGDDERSGQGIVAEDGGADLHRRLRAGDVQASADDERAGRDGQEMTPADRGHARSP